MHAAAHGAPRCQAQKRPVWQGRERLEALPRLRPARLAERHSIAGPDQQTPTQTLRHTPFHAHHTSKRPTTPQGSCRCQVTNATLSHVLTQVPAACASHAQQHLTSSDLCLDSLAVASVLTTQAAPTSCPARGCCCHSVTGLGWPGIPPHCCHHPRHHHLTPQQPS